MTRTAEEFRPLAFETGVQVHADGSCLVRLGNTHVLCAAAVEEKVPGWMKGKGRGWVTAEYGMLPGATHTRGEREAARGKQQGRTVEIQRLIGRALRQAVDLSALGERQITLDCDVLNADGGTRCAGITGAWVALALALRRRGLEGALLRQVAATSVGAVDPGEGWEGRTGLILDLAYEEDHRAAADANLVAARDLSGGEVEIVEFQASGEGRSLRRGELETLVDMGLAGCARLFDRQRQILA
ncbi:MAG: ribonuclease PH [Acidobacteria bacterium]|nr:ribonuclease PH [Acidobacteriota bacterium]